MKKTRSLTSMPALLLLPLLLAILTASASTVEGQGSSSLDAVLSGSPIGHNFRLSFYEGQSEQPAVAYSPDRQEYMVVWANQGWAYADIVAQRVTASGALVGDPFFVAAGPAGLRYDPDVTYNSQRREYLVVWALNTGISSSDIHAQAVSAEGGITGADVTIASSQDFCYSPVVAYSSVSDRYLVAWAASPGTTRELLGQVLNSDGTTSGSPSFIRQMPTSTTFGVTIDVAYNRSRNEYLVVWEEYPTSGDADIYGRRVQGNGTPMQPDRITITALSGDQGWPAVAGMPTEPNKGQYLVVWREELGGPNTGEIWARRVSGEGNTEGGYFRITEDPDEERHPDVAASEQDHQYLVVSGRYVEAGPEKFWVVLGRQVSLDGELLGPERWMEGNIVGRLGLANGPGSSFLIAFENEPPMTYKAIFGHLWGNHRVYLPLVLH